MPPGPGDKPSLAEADESPDAQIVLGLATWHECWACPACVSGGLDRCEENKRPSYTNRIVQRETRPKCYSIHKSRWYLLSVPRVLHKAFLRWVRAQDRSQDTSDILKNALGRVDISQKRDASGAT